MKDDELEEMANLQAEMLKGYEAVEVCRASACFVFLLLICIAYCTVD